MLNTVQIMAQAQPHPSMLFDEVYEKGERVIPKEDGRWTIFSANRLFSKDDSLDAYLREDVRGGIEAPFAVQVTWVAADEVAYHVSVKAYQETVQSQQKKIMVPETPKLVGI